jgi:hypothetical protein
MCPLNNMFLHEINAFHCVTVDISVENCVYFKVVLCCFKGVLWGAAFNETQGLLKWFLHLK